MPEQISRFPPVATIGSQRLFQGDCVKIMAEMVSGSVDVVVTSPPYNLNLAYGVYDDTKTEEDYVNWLGEVACHIKRVLSPMGSFFLNISGSNSRPYIPFAVIVKLRNLGWHLQNHITWIKSIGIGNDSSGHFKPIPGRRFMHHNHEHIFHLTHTGAVPLDRLSIGMPFQDKSNISRRSHPRDLRCRGDTWFIPYPTVRSKSQKYWHPATFPVELPLWCIYLHGRKAATVLDPFVGTGSTLVAAHFAGATGIGVDIDPTYVATAMQRVTEAVETAMLVTLSADEMAELFKQDEAKRDGGGWQRRIVALQGKTNKSTGEVALSEEDVAWIKKHGSHPELGSWQRWIHAAFNKHIDLSRTSDGGASFT